MSTDAMKGLKKQVLRSSSLKEPRPAFSLRLMREYALPGVYYPQDVKINGTKATFDFMRPFAEAELTEVFWLLPIDVDGHLLTDGPVAISKGTLDEVSANPVDVFRVALVTGAYGIVLVHNHPGHTPDLLKASPNDIKMSNDFVKLGWLHNIPVFDCMIINSAGYYSLGEHGQLPRKPIGDILSAIIGN